MNANTFRLIFSKRLGMCVPVSEQHSAQGKVASEKIAERVLGSLAFSLTLLCATPALALPVAPTVAHGSASFSQSGSTLTVTNTPNAIINWGSFSIGQNELTQFVQQSSASAVLNRVTGQSPSQILGQLQSNGRVFLINPNGIVFGQGARIDTAGLIASTLNLSDADFLTGKLKFSGTGSEAKVDNQGTISTAQGGFVYLIAPHVENSGLINAPNGDVLLAAGHSVEIADGLNPALRVLLTAPEGSVVNLGQVLAESGRIGLHGSMVANSGTVSASSAVVEGGKIYLRATEKIELTETSKLSADGTVGGEITAITQKDGQITGELVARGEISAQGSGAVGSGGFVETSAAKVMIDDEFKVATRGGHWLIDPSDFTIAASGGNITGATLSNSLNNATSGGVTIFSSSGTANGSGDINVNDAVSWSANTLTLTAARDININAVMTATGSAGLTMNTATSNSGDTGVSGGTVRVGFNPDGSFKGRVDMASGTELTINDLSYTLINDLTALQNMANSLGGNFALGSNIDASATSSWNSGAGFIPIGNVNTSFTGTLDGLGHTISGLTINRPTTDYVGLFGYTDGASLRNVGLVSATVTGDKYVGGLVGGTLNITVNNSYADVTLTGRRFLGGLIGNINWESSIKSLVSHTHATGTITAGAGGTADEVGGLIGSVYSGSTVNNTVISDSYSSVSISGGASSRNIGGLVGSLGDYSSISGSYATGTISLGDGSYLTGGLVGYRDQYADISTSYASSTITSGASSSDIGGLIGSSDLGGSVSQSYASGSITVGNNSHDIGGLIGWNNGRGVSDVYATTAVTTGTASYDVGGLVGENGGAITRAYSSGKVTAGAGSTTVGGLVGILYTASDGSVINSYWNTETSGLSTSDGGVGLTTAQMKVSTNFSGWDFSTVWNIDPNVSYPYLRNPEQIPHPPLTTCSICSWDGGGGSNYLWSLPANWTGNLLPTTASTVTIGSGFGTILFDITSLSLTALTASSALTIQSGKTLTLTGSATFNALVSGSGTLEIAGAAVNTTASAINVANLLLSSGSLALNGGNVTGNLTLNGGTLKGTGTITGNVTVGAATLAPGASPGTLNITGNLTLSPTSTTLIELWGTTAGLFDVINVSGIASLAGALNATTGNGYVPGVGHALRFMTFASKTGSFGSMSLPSGMSLSALATALDLLGPLATTALPPNVSSTVNQVNNSLTLGAVSYETPLLYLAGQSSPTASSSGTLTQTAEIVLPDLMPQAPSAGDSGDDANNASAVAGLTPMFDQLVRDARFKDTPHDSRLICR